MICVLAGLAAPAHSASIHKCEDENGRVRYQDRQCQDPGSARTIDDSTYTVSGRGGLTDAEWEAYHRLREERAARVQARIESGRAALDTRIGYQGRLRLRELRMRRDAIMESLDRGSQPAGEKIGLRRELKALREEEEAILSGRSQYPLAASQ